MVKWWDLPLTGQTPVSVFTLVAIVFTSVMDMGFVMFPVTFDYPHFADIGAEPAYAFTNPLALEFGFWGFLVWAVFFLTTFYFCALEPHVKFFEIPAVRLVNIAVILTTAAFTGAMFLIHLPFYLPEIGQGEAIFPVFYVICFLVIAAAAYSATDIGFVRVLSVCSMFLFLALILFMAVNADMGARDLAATGGNIGGYFSNIHKFILPLTGYHEFYLWWWFALSVTIGQFVSRFVGGLRTWQLLALFLVAPSIPLALWFTVMYFYHLNGIGTAGLPGWAMTAVGIVFVVNTLDSLIRLYGDTVHRSGDRSGTLRAVGVNTIGLFALVIVFRSQWFQIQWAGSVVIGLYLAALGHMVFVKRPNLPALSGTAQAPRI